ncbi:hypothetical protein TCAL_01694 [Tigriopus californicus]|uniref:Uncharacterized protein n=1 Tax=Tigriopus californicus TaxID=6832 RepID=A0A553PL10_TIGCA|nr:uncharacterized protein LOC131889793 [Tigriopus californicus]XP_059094966.1 uncharacterized protein LOC131889793 [Tigriopus californicus]TRY78377.1 hypothetical protein TCAL_01694 [Tigriopus californicus]|eukprot:TCALIF_01694-PA protein Name:"Protein of unknown function" AED:0.26 eAED:0.26 QI:9/1/0.66/1/1/1/3/0/524
MAGETTRSNGDMSRQLGHNELFAHVSHNNSNLNVMCGLTLLTRQAVDEGLMKCALQEFQHMFPQLTSRIREDQGHPYFAPMECPTFPLDTEFKCQDMLHTKFNTSQGPLWRVQLVTEDTMEQAALSFGPEIAAIIGDDSDVKTRWRYFLRYFQGKVNQSDIEKFDEDADGFRSFILMVFHPSITDTLGCFHLLRQFLVILDAILEENANVMTGESGSHIEELHKPIENLIAPNEYGFHLSDLMTMSKMMGSYMMPRKSPFDLVKCKSEAPFRTEVLRGWLNSEQTSELLALMDDDDVSLHGVILAAGLLATSRILQGDCAKEQPPSKAVNMRASQEANLRLYCPTSPKYGCLGAYFDSDFVVQPITDRIEFWRFAHEVTMKHNTAKGNKEPLKVLRIYSKLGALGDMNGPFKDLERQTALSNELGVAVYGDLSNLFRRENSQYQSLDMWNRPLSMTQRNIRLEDVFHTVARQNMGSPVTHTAHVLHGKLNYIMSYYTTYLGQREALMLRDEMVNILRMATDPQQ